MENQNFDQPSLSRGTSALEKIELSTDSWAMLGQIEDGQFAFDSEKMNKYEVGRSFYLLGKLHYDKADLSEAETFFIKAYQCCELPKDIFSVLKIFGFLIRIASEKLEDDKASTYIKEAQTLMDNYSQNMGHLNAESFYNLGILNTYQGLFSEANKYYELAFKKSKEENEPELLAKTLLSLAQNAFNRKDFTQATDFLAQLEGLLKIIKKNYLLGAMHFLQAKVALEMNQLEAAQSFYSKANSTFQEKNCWNLFGYILLGKGEIYKKQGNYNKALDMFMLAKESVDRLKFRRLYEMIVEEIEDVNDSSVDIYLDRINRKVKERNLGVIDFKHRFVLLEILFLLARNSGSPYDKEQLAREIWKDEYNPLIHDKLIYTSVSRLRKLIEPKDTGDGPRKYIIRGKDGYTFNPHVKIRFHLDDKVNINKTIGNVELGQPV